MKQQHEQNIKSIQNNNNNNMTSILKAIIKLAGNNAHNNKQQKKSSGRMEWNCIVLSQNLYPLYTVTP